MFPKVEPGGYYENGNFVSFTNSIPPVRKSLLSYKESSLLALGTTGMLVAPGGVGKTQLLTQLAISVASGEPFLNTYEVDYPGHVYMLCGEEDRDEVHRRIFNSMRFMSPHAYERVAQNLWAQGLASFPLALLEQSDKKVGKQSTRVWEETKAFGELFSMLTMLAQERCFTWRLIILEPASRFMALEAENDNGVATRFIQTLERLTHLPGAPVVLVGHHANKGAVGGKTDQTAARGASALTDGVRWQGNLDRVFVTDADTKKQRLEPAFVDFKVVKWNYGPLPPPLELERIHDGVLVPRVNTAKEEKKAAKGYKK